MCSNKRGSEKENLEETIQHILSSVSTAEFLSKIKRMFLKLSLVCEPIKTISSGFLKSGREKLVLTL
jgi:hypothetical protein